MGERSTEKESFHLENLARLGGFDFTDTFHMYTSFQIGPYYVQSAVVQKDGEYYMNARNDLALLIARDREGIDVISGGESRDWIFSQSVANHLRLSHVMIYKDGKTLGADMNGKRVGHVADLNNEGSSFRDKWVPAINNGGGTIKNAYFYVERMEEGVQILDNLGISGKALIYLDGDAWNILRKQDVLSSTAYRNLMKRGEMGNHEWAIEMLRSKDGLNRIKSFYNSADEKTRARARGVLDIGYPELKDEILERIGAVV